MDLTTITGKYFTSMYLESELQCMLTLLDVSASGARRFGLACTFCYFGYTEDETFEFIKKYNRWKNFNVALTKKNIRKAYLYKQRKLECGVAVLKCPSTITPLPNNINITPWEWFFQNVEPVPPLDVPSDNMLAALYYLEMGFCPLPKHKKFMCVDKKTGILKVDGKYPSIDWDEYKTRVPTKSEINNWDWSHGVCLIIHPGQCFLDIDNKLPEAQKIIKYCLEKGKKYHCEYSPSRGLHFFGKGYAPKSFKIVNMGEIKRASTLIVVSPTSDYIIQRR